MRMQADNYQYLCSQLVTVEYLDDLGQKACLTANLEEISRTRLWVLSESKIPSQSPIVVQCNGQSLRGRLQKSQLHEPLGWFCDVKLDPKSRWSEEVFVPEHMFKVPLRTKAAVVAA